MNKFTILGAALLSMSMLGLSGGASAKKTSKPSNATSELSDGAGAQASQERSSGVSLRNYRYTFNQLGVTSPLQLRGAAPIYSIPFSIPADQVVTALRLKLDFSYSPSLLTQLSHLKVMVNGEVAQTIPLPKEHSGEPLIREISIDPRLVTDFNRLSLQLIGHYTLDCEDPFHSSLWLNVSNRSSLQFTVTPLALANDLALLPVPFFDRRDSRRLERPFVFGANPSVGTLEAAGIVASWFGDLANYRGAWFPASLNRLPVDNVVVFATPEDRPQGLLDLPAINGPTISVGPHPVDKQFKILYVMGRDAGELRDAATSLGLGQIALAGQTVSNAKLSEIKKRVPYDAPRWLPSDRPVKFGELTALNDLNVKGLSPDYVRLNFTAPPDLFGWKTSGVPFDLKFRYTPRSKQDKSNLNVLLNENFVTSYPLLAFTGQVAGDSPATQWLSKLAPADVQPAREKFYMPLAQLRSRSQVQFHFSFDYPKEGSCKDVELDNVRAAIDPDSEIDISRFPHYMRMPNLGAFANTGYPFTRMADLSETAVIMPNDYDALDIGTYLTIMGRMGESTGLPVHGVTVARSSDVQSYAGKDILLLGGVNKQPLLREWAKHMPFSTNENQRMFLLSELRSKLMPWYETVNVKNSPVARLTADTLAKDSLLFGFESPLKSGRSVVALTADRGLGQAEVLSALMDPEVVPKIQGDVAIVRGKDVDAYELNQEYYVGRLPPIMAVRWWFSNNPWVSAAIIILLSVLLAGVVYAVLRRQAQRRISGT